MKGKYIYCPLELFKYKKFERQENVKIGLLLTYGLATRHACYAPATRRRFFAREPYYRSLMARLLKHKWPKTWHN